MQIVILEIKLYAPWVHSLKEKRMEVKSLLAKLRAKFNVSVAETDAQDLHQTIIVGVAAVAGNSTQADSMIDHILNFIEVNSEAEIVNVNREIRQ